MAVAVLIPQDTDLPQLVEWAGFFARSRDEDLFVWRIQNRSGNEAPRDVTAERAPELVETITASAGPQFTVRKGRDTDSDPESPTRTVAIREFSQSNAVRSVLERVQTDHVSLLIVPRHASTRSTDAEFSVQRQLFRDALCEVMQLRLGADGPGDSPSVLVPCGGGPDSRLTLNLASHLAEVHGSRIVALYVEPEVDEVATLVGRRILDRLVDEGGNTTATRPVERRVVLSQDIAAGILQEATRGYDLLLMGTHYHGRVHRLLFRGTSEKVIASDPSMCIAVVRTPLPWKHRIWRRIDQVIQASVPQLKRDQRVALVERVQSSSRWDFDFIALTCLSTLIAGMGLIQNAGAVVIGAMLVAPLMTPLLGAGLSLVQGNRVLLGNALITVTRGFVLAFGIGLFLGWISPLLLPGVALPSPEMLARCFPSILDLFVAFLSGIAAAYASGRRNLLSALPGVAIAAALVPPIAVAGIFAAMGEISMSLGALLLFFTNIVAIVLGTACSVWAVGVRGSHQHGPFSSWTLRVAVALVLLVCGIGIYELLPQKTQLPPGVLNALRAELEREPGRSLDTIRVQWKQRVPCVDLHIQSNRPLSERELSGLVPLVRRGFHDQAQLVIRTQLVQTLPQPAKDLSNAVQ